MKLALGQINPTVGDLSGNTDRMIEIAEQAAKQGGELVIFPELAVSGYPPLDLVEVPAYLRANEEEIQRLARATRNLDLDIIAGYAGRAGAEARRLAANRAAHISGGEILHTQQKMLLPTYDVFDEWRYFEPAESQDVWNIRGCRVGVTICEDVWNDKRFWDRQRYERDPVEELVAQGMDCLINISASPLPHGQAPATDGNDHRRRQPAPAPRGDGEPDRRQRSACLRRIEFRRRSGWRDPGAS